MTLTQKQMRMIPQLKTELTYSKVEHLLSQYYEDQLAKEVSKIFQEMEYRVINNLAEYYNPEVMFKAHTDLILAPIHEMHKDYYELLCKYKIREFDKSRASGKRIVERLINFRRRGNIISKQYTVLKADLNDAVSSTITKDKLFGTSPDVHENLETRTYQLSEKTLARVDGQINDIIVNGYEEGMGIDKVSRDIRRRFGQLKTWESVRIARTEIHNSQCLGVIKGYDDMGVEYIQWSTARDSRVRGLKPKDSADHIHMEGEIIRMGGVFSNGLMYPGDMAGPAAEIINCRCQALPFIIPYGYIAPPDMAQFREDDLIATLDYFDADELINQAMAETNQMPSDDDILQHILGKHNIDQNDLFTDELFTYPTLEEQRRIGKAQLDYFELMKKSHPNDPDYTEIYNEIKQQVDNIERLLENQNKDIIIGDLKFIRDKLVRHRKSGRILGKSEVEQILLERGLYNKDELKSLARYKSDTYERINDYLWNNAKHKHRKSISKDVDLLLKQIKKEIKMLDSAIEKSPGLTKNTRLVRFGEFDSNLKVGDEGVLKGFTSTSYVEDGIQGYKSGKKKYMEILAPKGQKGVSMNGVNRIFNEEHEFLLPRNQRYRVLEVDEDHIRILLLN